MLHPAPRPVPNRGRRRQVGSLFDVVASAWKFFSDPDASIALKLLFLLSALYVVTPADLVPDVLPVIGWLDDLGVAALAATFLGRAIRPYRAGAAAPTGSRDPVVETTGANVR